MKSFLASPRRANRTCFALLLGTGAALAVSGACSSDDIATPTTSSSGQAGTGGSAGATGVAGSGTSAGGSLAGSTTTGNGGEAGSGAGGTGGSAGSAGSGGVGGIDGGTDASSNDGGVGQCKTAPGKALQFDGTIVDLMTGDLGADLPGGDVPRTIEVWAKYSGAASWTAEHSIMETGLMQGGNNMVFGFDNSGYMGTTAEFGPYTNGYSDNNHPNGVYVMNIPQSGWLHLSWSYTGNHGKLSFTVNGAEHPVTTMAGSPTFNLTPGIVTLGASQTFGTQGWTGVMDEVRLWSVAKTPSEIQRDMKVVLKGTEPGLVAYYRFDEGSGAFTDDVAKKPSHRLSACVAKTTRCAAVNAANPKWVDSDLPGPFTCAP